MIRHIPISTSSSGNTELVAAVAGYPVVVIAYTLVCGDAVNVKFSDGADLTGAMPFAANGGVSAPHNRDGHFATRPGYPLNLNLSGAVAVAGHLTVKIGGSLPA